MRLAFKGRLLAVLQPHLYSRTKRFYKEFGGAFFDADALVVLDVFPSRERPIDGVSGKMIADAAIAQGHKDVSYIENKEALPEYMKSRLSSGDRVILFGAGDIYKYTQKIMEKLKE
jgi:UDP-N-acetylmuramate--alanine ligase